MNHSVALVGPRVKLRDKERVISYAENWWLTALFAVPGRLTCRCHFPYLSAHHLRLLTILFVPSSGTKEGTATCRIRNPHNTATSFDNPVGTPCVSAASCDLVTLRVTDARAGSRHTGARDMSMSYRKWRRNPRFQYWLGCRKVPVRTDL